MEKNPERKGVPSPLDKAPTKKPSEEVRRGLGRAAIKGANSKK